MNWHTFTVVLEPAEELAAALELCAASGDELYAYALAMVADEASAVEVTAGALAVAATRSVATGRASLFAMVHAECLRRVRRSSTEAALAVGGWPAQARVLRGRLTEAEVAAVLRVGRRRIRRAVAGHPGGGEAPPGAPEAVRAQVAAALRLPEVLDFLRERYAPPVRARRLWLPAVGTAVAAALLFWYLGPDTRLDSRLDLSIAAPVSAAPSLSAAPVPSAPASRTPTATPTRTPSRSPSARPSPSPAPLPSTVAPSPSTRPSPGPPPVVDARVSRDTSYCKGGWTAAVTATVTGPQADSATVAYWADGETPSRVAMTRSSPGHFAATVPDLPEGVHLTFQVTATAADGAAGLSQFVAGTVC